MVLLNKLYDESTEDKKKVLLRKLKDLAAPYMTLLKEPTPVIPKGRPRTSKRKLSQKEKKNAKSTNWDPSGFEYAMTGEERDKKLSKISDKCSQVSNARIQVEKKPMVPFETYKQFIPTMMHPFIANIENVSSDGHCGFRVVAKQMEWHDDEHDWKAVRYDLLGDLNKFQDIYDTVWGTWFCIDNRNIIDFFKPRAYDSKYWMMMPDAGFMIASAYNCVVVLLSNKRCLTLFPHAEPPPKGSEVRIICLAYVQDNHFVKVTLKDNSPLPPVASMWYVLRSHEAAVWEELFADRLQFYKDGCMVTPRTKVSPIIIK